MVNPMSYFRKSAQKSNKDDLKKKVAKDAIDLKKEEAAKHQKIMHKLKEKPTLDYVMPGNAAARIRHSDRAKKEFAESKRYARIIQEIDNIESDLLETIESGDGKAPIPDVRTRVKAWEKEQYRQAEHPQQHVDAAPLPSQDTLSPEYEAWMAGEVAAIEAQPDQAQRTWTPDQIAAFEAIKATRDAERHASEHDHDTGGHEIP